MAESEQTQEQAQSADEGQANGSNGSRRKTAIRAAAIAAASGATAVAARKVFSGGARNSESSWRKPGRNEGATSNIGRMVASGWEAAKDSLLPVAEDAASAAGEYVARSGPDVVRERIVPRFIQGFERENSSRSDD
jgi:hypothetical protein